MEVKVAGQGLGLPSILFIVFLILKLCNVITWSWWWVFSPLWIYAGLVLAIIAIIFIVGFIAVTLFDK